jgi:SAM-dependent methyltransferase
MAFEPVVNQVGAHYSVRDLEQSILKGLEKSGANLDVLTVEDLAGVDHFHIGGLDASLDLLRLAEIQPGSEVLDVGGGLGGAARVLATKVEAKVTVLDATVEYCRVGERLTALVGLSDRVIFRPGDGCDIPFGEGTFDLVWMQHANMNIEDKGALFSEMYRVLRPGGRVAFHEVMAGSMEPVLFPVPWAGRLSISFLRRQDEVRDLIATAGFTEVIWKDVTESNLEMWKQRLAATTESGPPPLGVHLLMGTDAPVKAKNVLRNLEEERITVVQAVLERP